MHEYLNRRGIFVSKKVQFEVFFYLASYFLRAKELLFFDLLIPDSGINIPDSGFGFRIPLSLSGFRLRFPVFAFRLPGLRVARLLRSESTFTIFIEQTKVSF